MAEIRPNRTKDKLAAGGVVTCIQGSPMSADMVDLVAALLEEEHRRREAGRTDHAIPFRPDHGHELLDDAARKTHPGYPLIGRLRGLAELRGVIAGLSYSTRPAAQ